VAAALGRRFVLVDRNREAIDVMRKRLPHTTVFSVV
jgi:DNA modification methylase